MVEAEKGQVVYFQYTEEARFSSMQDTFAFGLDSRDAYPAYANCTLRLVIVFLFNGSLCRYGLRLVVQIMFDCPKRDRRHFRRVQT